MLKCRNYATGATADPNGAQVQPNLPLKRSHQQGSITSTYRFPLLCIDMGIASVLAFL
jgi:hypothetical protein